MKLKRRLMLMILSSTMLLSGAIVAYASNSTGAGSNTIYSRDYNLSLYGYIDLVSGGLVLEDEYLYNVALSGDDMENYVPTKNDNVYVKVKDDEGDTAVTVKPYYADWYISSSIYYGRWSDCGVLDMKCFDVTGEVVGY